MTCLSVNLNKVALLRNQRDLDLPSVTWAADVAVAAGADGITVHPRPDERHIRTGDVFGLAERLAVEFNIEGYPDTRYMDIVRRARPAQATLVPDAPNQKTSDHGWDLEAHADRLRPILAELKDQGIRTSLFVDAEPERIPLAAELGADRVELYTEPYARAFGTPDEDDAFERFRASADAAQEAGLGVNAGHDLNLHNLPRFVTIPGVLEVSIGHALIADALERGLAGAVKAYLAALGRRDATSTQPEGEGRLA